MLAFPLVMGDQGAHIHIRYAIALSETKTAAVEIRPNPAQSATSLTQIAGIHQGHLPGLAFALVDLHVIVDIHMEVDITGMKKVVCGIFLDEIALVATANYEFVDAKVAVDLEDVQEDRFATNFNHWLGLEVGFFAEAGAKATS